MWFIITAVAALVTSALWYRDRRTDKHRLGFLALIYWGATLMWLVDHIIAYAQEGGAFFEIDAGAVWLAILVLVLGLFIWAIRLVAYRRRPVPESTS